MRKFLAGALGAVILALASAGSAQANCHSWRCVNRQLNSLNIALAKADATIKQQSQTINHNAQLFGLLVGCLGEAPLTTYGDPAGTFGYVFNLGPAPNFDTTALDVTGRGDTVGGWALFDTCNKTPRAPARLGPNAVAPRAQGLFLQPQSRSR